MKKSVLFILSLIISATGFARSFELDNQTPYPGTNSKIAVQWAESAKEVEEGNQAIMHGEKLNSHSIQKIKRFGMNKIHIPKKAEHFRVLVWSTGNEEPDLLTNWLEVVPDKTYTLTPDYLTPAVLMSGMGC